MVSEQNSNQFCGVKASTQAATGIEEAPKVSKLVSWWYDVEI